MSRASLVALRARIKARLGHIVALAAGALLGGLVVGAWQCQSVPVDGQGSASAGQDTEPREAEGAPVEETWSCSMHPQIQRPEQGACPICGMDLIPVPAAGGAEPEPGTLVLSDRARALARLRTVTVQRRVEEAAEVRLLGRVEPNETSLKTVTAWTGGRIDKLHASVTGERVRAGQVVATLYSPEVFAAHQDLLVAKRQTERLAEAAGGSREAALSALAAARERLRLLGVPDEELERMEAEARPTRAVDIRTPYGGTVIERRASEGAYVATGAVLYQLADLRSLWVQLDAYESDLSRLATGQPVSVHVEALPGEEFAGEITFIDPTLDTTRRTALVRVEVNNRDGRLRPGMFAEATVMATGAGERSPLVIPASAPLFTGRRAIVYLEQQVGERTVYEPRSVRLGPRLGDFYPVVAGLSEGERIVTRGAFVLDADLQIRGGPSMMAAADHGERPMREPTIELRGRERRLLAPVVSAYLAVQRALAADQLSDAKTAAGQLEQEAAAVKLSQPSTAIAAWTDVAQALRGHARRVRRAGDLESARAGFEGLSESVAALLRQFGNPLEGSLQLAFCPMALGSQGASWFQQGAEIDNAYFGEAMRSCGEVRTELAPGEYLRAPGDGGEVEAPVPPGRPGRSTAASAAPPAGRHRH